MMKNKFLFLCAFFCALGFFVACSDDDKNPVDPTVEQVLGEYSADKLNVKVDGKVVADAKIDVIQEADNSISLKLFNIVPGVVEYIMPNVTYGTQSRAASVSTLKGTVVDNVVGYDIVVEGVVDNEVLTATVTTKVIVGVPVNPERFIGVRFKGNMVVSVSGTGEPVKIEQMVYITKTTTTDTNTFCLNIKDFEFDNTNLGDITLDSVSVVKRGDVYAFSTEGCKLKLEGALPMEVTLDVRGAIVNNNTMKMNLAIDVAGALKVDVVFEGKEYAGFAMNKWNTFSGKNALGADYSYQEPVYMATSNYAAVFLALVGISSEPYFVSHDEVENAAKIISRDTKGSALAGIVVPKVTAGTLFNGTFVLNAMETLKSTRFGTSCGINPKVLKFTYKYTPGEVFYETKITGSGWGTKVEGIPIDGKIDECSVAAYLYEVDSYDESLDGTNINAPESKVILKAMLTGGKQDSFVTKEIKFEETGKGSYDPSKKYKLAIVCTPSKEGDKYMGAPGSTLWVKNLEVVAE